MTSAPGVLRRKGDKMDFFDDGLTVSELTVREREILHLTAGGMSAKEIAQEVGITARTVERHVENVRHKLRARNKGHMIAKAVALGVLHLNRIGPRPLSTPHSTEVALGPKQLTAIGRTQTSP